MPSKTISVRIEAYEKLRRARLHPAESFSDVVMRARWDEQTISGGELLARVRERGPVYAEEELDDLADMKAEERPATDKW